MNRNKLCITVDEAAELASVAPAVIRQWAEDFDFPSMKIGQRGGKRLIHLDSFNAQLAKRCQARIGEQKGINIDEVNLDIKSSSVPNDHRDDRFYRN